MNILLLPPIAFGLILVSLLIFFALSGRLAAKPSTQAAGKTKSYACGEEVTSHRAQPEYTQFFPFAFFFTIMHVVALIVATAPIGSLRISAVAALYLLASAIGLFILYRS